MYLCWNLNLLSLFIRINSHLNYMCCKKMIFKLQELYFKSNEIFSCQKNYVFVFLRNEIIYLYMHIFNITSENML